MKEYNLIREALKNYVNSYQNYKLFNVVCSLNDLLLYILDLNCSQKDIVERIENNIIEGLAKDFAKEYEYIFKAVGNDQDLRLFAINQLKLNLDYFRKEMENL